MNKLTLACALALACTGASAQIFKCPDANGRTVFQQAPCAGGTSFDVRPASGSAPARPKPVAAPAGEKPAPIAKAPPAPATRAPAPVAQKSELDRDADLCFEWYRPMLRDPRSAYYTEPKRDKRVVSINVHGTNLYGGIVEQDAACEILDGRLNESWTKIHAERRGWLSK